MAEMTAWLTAFFTSGWVSVIAILVLWTVTIAAARLSPAPRATLRALLANAVSGSALLAAFGGAMRQGPILLLAGLLALSLIAFLLDLRARLSAQASGLRRRTE
ncbi:hypothetical protein [Rhizobium wuzhouense]|uniref:Uncharacterized protein n=1 Tax=Rhizobium wuzhouense TaxID=1986026 RepID=A0ABX5NQW9_9HYPH|nr:hypothetical protein [Rhizobium wuzhouense]PYB71926.1 hypothetical protein DMY87_17205 [Rhizobium wuzhouense]